jgi:peptidyl-prolyl cis-trans isomerase A (cyclophilin A)/peptidyl-prolyl cis-trans isomerase B (cyclophilin B)
MFCQRTSAKVGLLLILAALAAAAGCGSNGAKLPAASISAGEEAAPAEAVPGANTGDFTPSEFVTTWPDEEKAPPKPKPNLKPVVTIKTSLGEISVRLDAEKAPITVDNFLVNYVDNEYYDETVFHYVEEGYLIAAGGYTADLKPKEAGAQILNEAASGLKNRRGTIAMARQADYANSASSQFFFNLVDNKKLDFTSAETDEEAGYCVFGEVIEGLDILDRIAAVEVHDADEFTKVPKQAVVIESIRRVK